MELGTRTEVTILREIFSQSFDISFNEVHIFFVHVILYLFILILPQIRIEIVRLSLFSGRMKPQLFLFLRVNAKMFGMFGLHFRRFYDKIHHPVLIGSPWLDLFLREPQLRRRFCVIHHFLFIIDRGIDDSNQAWIHGFSHSGQPYIVSLIVIVGSCLKKTTGLTALAVKY